MQRPMRILFVAAAAFCGSAGAFTVTNTNDSGGGSLRQAILDANAASPECAAQSIGFNIPGSGVHTISPLSPLPEFDIPITLDGYSQPGSAANTLNDGTNAVITIELDGSLAGSSNGLVIGWQVPLSGFCGGGGSVIDGIVINRFALAGIEMSETACPSGYTCAQVGGIVLYGSFIGTDTTGTTALGNGVGLHFGLNSGTNVVGDQVIPDGGPQTPQPLTRNIISGNLSDGVRLDSSDVSAPSSSHRIRNNYIGVDATGTHALPNGRYGVLADTGSSAEKIQDNIIAGHSTDGVRIVGGQSISVQSNAIGVGLGGVALPNAGDGIHVTGGARGVTTGGYFISLGNQGLASVAHNAGAGLYVESEASVDVYAGWFGSNGGLGIDLAPRGVNANDSLDGDDGPNELLNTPVLLTATYDTSVSPPATVTGTLDTTPNSTNEIDFYISGSCDPSGHGEGEQPSYSITNVNTDASGHATFSQSGYFLKAQVITALTRRFSATDPTIIVSEFSNCVTVGDEIFGNGFGG